MCHGDHLHRTLSSGRENLTRVLPNYFFNNHEDLESLSICSMPGNNAVSFRSHVFVWYGRNVFTTGGNVKEKRDQTGTVKK
jgi:hypothetical protein